MTVATRRKAKTEKPIREVERGECLGFFWTISRDPNDDTYPMHIDGDQIGFAYGVDEARLTISEWCQSNAELAKSAIELDGGSNPDQIANEYAADLETRAVSADMAADAAEGAEIGRTDKAINAAGGYIRSIRNPAKRAYAEAYLNHRVNGSPAPVAAGIGAMAEQAVRLQIDSIVSAEANAAEFRAELAERAGPEWNCTPEDPCDGECADHLSLTTAIHLNGETSTRTHETQAARDEYLRYNPSAWIVEERDAAFAARHNLGPEPLPAGMRTLTLDAILAHEEYFECPCEGDGMCSTCDTERDVTSYDDGDATPEQIAQRDAENEAAMLEWLHESDVTAPQAPTRDDLAAALDAAVTARRSFTRGTPEWDAAQVAVEQAHEALDPVGYRAARGALGAHPPSPHASLGEDPEGADEAVVPIEPDPVPSWLTLGGCEGYDWEPCPNPATQTLTINIALNSQASITPDLIKVCDTCAVKWQPRVIPAGTCRACGKEHSTQRCPEVRAALLAPANDPLLRAQLEIIHYRTTGIGEQFLAAALDQARASLYDRGAGTGGDPVLPFYKPVAPDDPCAGVRAELLKTQEQLEKAQLHIHHLSEIAQEEAGTADIKQALRKLRDERHEFGIVLQLVLDLIERGYDRLGWAQEQIHAFESIPSGLLTTDLRVSLITTIRTALKG